MPDPNITIHAALACLTAGTALWFTGSALTTLQDVPRLSPLDHAWRFALAIAAWLAFAIAWRTAKPVLDAAEQRRGGTTDAMTEPGQRPPVLPVFFTIVFVGLMLIALLSAFNDRLPAPMRAKNNSEEQFQFRGGRGVP
jgi:hypothetical protein